MVSKLPASVVLRELTEEEVADFLLQKDVINCCNLNHQSTLNLLTAKGFRLPTPASLDPKDAPRIEMQATDEILVFQIIFPQNFQMPRGREYTEQEIKIARTKWVLVTVA
jgi:hypothetical protein